MEIGLRLGIDKFYDYLTNFGFGEKTGIDLQGESTGIIFDKSIMTDLELATSSFGQGNSSTMIQLNMAANSCINGGILYKPYTVKMVSNSHEIVLKNDPNEIRRTISKETSEKVKYALESVSARGTGRGAYIDGYRIGGKTGTSQISENGKYADGKYILSFIGFAPMDDVEASVYVEIENPKNTIQYGGVVAAPIAKSCFESILPILNTKKSNSSIEYVYRYGLDANLITVDDYVGKKLKKINKQYSVNYLVIGDGDTVISQSPEKGEKIKEGDTIILYL